MTCTTSIVECLRNKGVYPTAEAATQYSSSQGASIALTYDTSNNYNSNTQSVPQWWKVDLKQTVNIEKYQIRTPSSGCKWVTNWTASVSLNDISYSKVDAQQGYPVEKIFSLKKPMNARFFKIDGNSPLCKSPGMAFYYVKLFGSLKPALTYNQNI